MTRKFDSIAISFLDKVKGEFETTFTPGMVMPNADFLTAIQISNYVNSALIQLYDSIFQQAKGDTKIFTGVLPELVQIRDVTLTSGIYTVASPNLDFSELIEASGDGAYGVVGKKHLFQAIKLGNVQQYTGTLAKPIFVEMGLQIYCFPTTITTAQLTIIKQPIDPTTGNSLVQNGTYDSPFKPIWENRLAQIAYELYLTDSNKQS